jgi:hypothetical protein
VHIAVPETLTHRNPAALFLRSPGDGRSSFRLLQAWRLMSVPVTWRMVSGAWCGFAPATSAAFQANEQVINRLLEWRAFALGDVAFVVRSSAARCSVPGSA